MSTVQTEQDEQFLTGRQIAARLRVTPRWVTEKTASGLIPCRRLPGSNRYRYLWSEVRAALAGNTT